MKRPPLWEAGAEVQQQKQNVQSKSSTSRSSPQIPDVIDLPVDGFHPRPMRKSERSLVVCTWWAMRRYGVNMTAEPGVIVLNGGRS